MSLFLLNQVDVRFHCDSFVHLLDDKTNEVRGYNFIFDGNTLIEIGIINVEYYLNGHLGLCRHFEILELSLRSSK